MHTAKILSLNLGGRLLEFDHPIVMGILNCTPDSFYAASRTQSEREIITRAEEIMVQGGAIIDIGGFSTRPGFAPVDQEEEIRRLAVALHVIRSRWPDVWLSVDTFRQEVAHYCIEEWGVQLINNVSTSAFSPALPTEIPQVVTSHAATIEQMLEDLSQRVEQLRQLGQHDIIIDPGFGFGKTIDENYSVLDQLSLLQALRCPLLVGLSRKSMLQAVAGVDAAHAQNATTAAHMAALQRGANILRVHDVSEAVETIKIFEKLTSV